MDSSAKGANGFPTTLATPIGNDVDSSGFRQNPEAAGPSDLKLEAASPLGAISDNTVASVNHDNSEENTPEKTKKPLAFHLSFIALQVMSFVYSLDATTLAVAIPVRILANKTTVNRVRLTDAYSFCRP